MGEFKVIEVHQSVYAINDAIAEEKEWITVELEEETGLPLISDGEDVELGENEFLRNVQVILHLQEGFDS